VPTSCSLDPLRRAHALDARHAEPGTSEERNTDDKSDKAADVGCCEVVGHLELPCADGRWNRWKPISARPATGVKGVPVGTSQAAHLHQENDGLRRVATPLTPERPGAGCAGDATDHQTLVPCGLRS
jgi:hypothetical protein